MKNKPCSVLPAGAKLIKPIKKRISGWVEMEFDAMVRRHGLDWYRVKGGFGQRGDREDWVADIPEGSLSVSGCNEDWFGEWRGTFDEQVSGQIKKQLDRAVEDLKEARVQLLLHERAVEMLKDSAQSISHSRTVMGVRKQKPKHQKHK